MKQRLVFISAIIAGVFVVSLLFKPNQSSILKIFQRNRISTPTQSDANQYVQKYTTTQIESLVKNSIVTKFQDPSIFVIKKINYYNVNHSWGVSLSHKLRCPDWVDYSFSIDDHSGAIKFIHDHHEGSRFPKFSNLSGVATVAKTTTEIPVYEKGPESTYPDWNFLLDYSLQRMEYIPISNEESGLAVYKTHNNWCQIGFSVNGVWKLGWVKSEILNPPMPIISFIRTGNQYRITSNWDGDLYDTDSAESIQHKLPQSAAEFLSDPESHEAPQIELLELRTTNGTHWMRVDFLGNSEIQPRPVIATGWIRLFNTNGLPIITIYEGC